MPLCYEPLLLRFGQKTRLNIHRNKVFIMIHTQGVKKAIAVNHGVPNAAMKWIFRILSHNKCVKGFQMSCTAL